MTRLRTIIADDEPFLRQDLQRKLQSHLHIDLVAECENGLQALEATNRLQPDLIFLDIIMPGLDGFEVVKALQSDAMPIIVFATAYDQFAIKAFEVRALDYLVKPYSDERLQRSIETALSNHNDNASSKKQDIIELASHLGNSPIMDATDAVAEGYSEEIIIENRRPQTKVSVKDIAWIDAAGDYMCVHANGETHIMRSTMKNLNEQLNPRWFRRIHRSTIVNVRFIEDIVPFRKGDYFIMLTGGTRLRLSRNYNDTLKELLRAPN